MWGIRLLPGAVGSAGRKRLKQAHAFAPWIRWYRPVKEHPVARDYAAFFEDLRNIDKLPPLSNSGDGTDDVIHVLRRLWTDLTVEPPDRHAVSIWSRLVYFWSSGIAHPSTDDPGLGPLSV